MKQCILFLMCFPFFLHGQTCESFLQDVQVLLNSIDRENTALDTAYLKYKKAIALAAIAIERAIDLNDYECLRKAEKRKIEVQDILENYLKYQAKKYQNLAISIEANRLALLSTNSKKNGDFKEALLLAYLAKLAVDKNCTRVEWSVLDWNEPSIQFYRSIGAVPMDEWTVQRLDGDALASFAKEF